MSERNKKEREDDDKGFIFISIIVIVIIIGLWLGTYFLLRGKEPNVRGTFGDMFGSINALFSGLALAGIILTILLQRKELMLQRDELKDTRKEFVTQNETLKIQRFENTFFSLLNLHHQIVNAIDFRYYKKKEKEFDFGGHMLQSNDELETVVINGRDVFRNRYKVMIEEINKNPKNFEKIYLQNYEKISTDFGHYFRNLYRMIKLVDQADFFYDLSKVSQVEIFNTKYRYISIIRAQISDYESAWLFYNCLSKNGITKFKPYIERYSFFKNMPTKLVTSEHLALYDKKAFASET